MDERKPAGSQRAEPDSSGPNEGEGNRTADRAYRRGVEKFEASGQVEVKAREAANALDGPEGPSLRAAEEKGRRHSHGEDPALKKK